MNSVSYEEYLATGSTLVHASKGRSMLPLVREGKDLVIVERPQGALRKFDVALYCRGSQYVLHRVIGVEDGFYLIRGDNCWYTEHVDASQVIGVMTGLVRGGREVSARDWRMRLYARVWYALFPIRACARKVLHATRRMVRAYGA